MSNLSQSSFDTWFASKSVRTDFGLSVPVASPMPVNDVDMFVDSVGVDAEIDDDTYVKHQLPSAVQVPAVSNLARAKRGALATVIQIWEGTVLAVDRKSGSMSVKLHDRANLLEDHLAEIGLEWVVDQDLDLISPGAVFYWTIYKETKRGAISNSEEIRFRRLPNWSKKQIETIYEEADALLAKAKPGRFAD